jgi:hypothetical protein
MRFLDTKNSYPIEYDISRIIGTNLSPRLAQRRMESIKIICHVRVVRNLEDKAIDPAVFARRTKLSIKRVILA